MRAKFSTALFLSIAGLIGAIMIGVAVVGSQILRETIVQSARQNVESAAHHFRQQLGSRAEEIASATSVLVEDFGFQDALSSGDYATIRSAVDNHSTRIGASMAAIRLNDGRVISAGEAPAPSLTASPASSTMDIRITALDGIPHLIISTPVGASSFIGTLTLGFEMAESFAESMKELTATDITFVAGEQRQYLFSTLSQLPDQASLLRQLDQFNAGTPDVLEIDDQRLMTTLVELQNTENFYPFMHIPMTDEAEAFNRVSLQLSLLGAGAFLLILLMTSWLSRRITRPLALLSDVADGISEGDYAMDIPRQSIREFNRLGEAFSAMRQAVDERERTIHEQARRDLLTGLPNRLAALEHIRELADGRKSGAGFVVLAVDIHHLREINDSLGHETGDSLLVWLGEALASHSLPGSLVCRLASDDFLVIMPRANETDARAVASQLFEVTENSAQVGDNLKARIRINIGASLYPDHAEDPETLIRRAEQAMYKAKDARTIIEIYDARADAARKRRLELAHSLRTAIDRQEMSIHLQPSIVFDEPLEVYAQAFLRWDNATLGNISPQEFIPVAESSGQLPQLNAWVLEKTCALIGLWRQSGKIVPVTLQVGREDLADPGFVTRIIEATQKHHIERYMLTLQISEDIASRSLEQAKETLERLRRQRVRISIGNFGAGRSSLAMLREISVDEIRIDRSFTADLLDNTSDRAIIESLVHLAHKLGVQVIAEGVESKELLAVLREMGIDGAQGHFLSRALPPTQFEIWRQAWVDSKRRNSQ